MSEQDGDSPLGQPRGRYGAPVPDDDRPEVRILMLVMTDVVNDPRVRIEAETLRDAGHDITIIGHVQPPGDAHLEEIDVHWVGQARDVPRHRTRRLAAPMRAARWLLLPEHRSRARSAFAAQATILGRELAATFDVVHAHDMPTLAPAVELARDDGARLVYDAHELWTQRRLQGRPTPWGSRREQAREQSLGAHADAVLTVSEGIAMWYRDHYDWDNVRVVRNSYRLERHYDPPSGPPTAVVFAGRVDSSRDLGTAARALSARRDMTFHVYASDWVDVVLPTSAMVHDPVSEKELDDVYRRHGIALVSLSGGMVNHDLALPNKFFHAVRAGVPIIAADLPELRRMVVDHDLGALYRPGDHISFLRALDSVVANWPQHATAVAKAAKTLSWDRDGAVLLETYGSLERVNG